MAYAVFFMKCHSSSTIPISAFTLIHLSSPENYETVHRHAVIFCGMSPLSWSHHLTESLLTFVPDHLGWWFQLGRFSFWLKCFKGVVSPPTSHPWFVSVAWVFFCVSQKTAGNRLLLLAKRKDAENTKLQHISPTIVRSLIYLLAISRIAMEMTISVLQLHLHWR